MTRLTEMLNVNHFIISQVNPHVIHFCPRRKVLVVKQVVIHCLHTLTRLTVEEALHRMTILSELGDISKGINQGGIYLESEIFWGHQYLSKDTLHKLPTDAQESNRESSWYRHV